MDIVRALVCEYDAARHVADVRVAGSVVALLVDVPVAKNIDAALMVGEAKVLVWVPEGFNPGDALVFAVAPS